jgi:phosphatidate cytidylyltransferase
MSAQREPGADLAPRIVFAIPAILFAILIVWQGGEVFAIGLALLGVLALGELYVLMGRVRPPAVAGFAALIALLVTALYGEPKHVIMVLVAAFPVTFFLALLRPRREHVSWAIAAVLFGVLWIGLPMVHAIWLRELPHGDGLLIDVLVATFVGDTFAYFGGRWYGSRRIAPLISPNKTFEGLVAGFIGATMAFWFAGLYQDWLTRPHHGGAGGGNGADRGPVRVDDQAGPGGEGHRDAVRPPRRRARPPRRRVLHGGGHVLRGGRARLRLSPQVERRFARCS